MPMNLKSGFSVAALIVFLGPTLSVAQMVDAQAKLTYTLPIHYTDGKAIPAGALTKVQVWAKTAPILDASLGVPTVELAGTATAYTYVGQVPNGTTLYFRLKACALQACSVLSPQVSKGVKIDIPGVPSNVQVTVTVTLTSP